MSVQSPDADRESEVLYQKCESEKVLDKAKKAEKWLVQMVLMICFFLFHSIVESFTFSNKLVSGMQANAVYISHNGFVI